MIDFGFCSVFICRDAKGATVYVFNTEGYLPRQYGTDLFIAAMYILLEVLLEDPIDQQRGISFLLDASGMGFKNFHQETEKKLTDMFQVHILYQLTTARLPNPSKINDRHQCTIPSQRYLHDHPPMANKENAQKIQHHNPIHLHQTPPKRKQSTPPHNPRRQPRTNRQITTPQQARNQI